LIKLLAYHYNGDDLKVIDEYIRLVDNGTRPSDIEYISHDRTSATEPTFLIISWQASGDGTEPFDPNASTTIPTPPPNYSIDCSDADIAPGESNYTWIRLPNGQPIRVQCNKAANRGAYMVIQSRDQMIDDGADVWTNNYTRYLNWFGGDDTDENNTRNFWFGLENMRSLTTGANGIRYHLLIEACCDGTPGVGFADHYANFTIGPANLFYPIRGEAIGSSLTFGLDTVFGGQKDLGMAFMINSNNSADWHGDNTVGWKKELCQISTGGGGWWFGSCKNHLNAQFIDRDKVDKSTCKVYSNTSSTVLTDFVNGFGAEYRRIQGGSIPFSPSTLGIDGVAFTKIRMSVIRSSEFPPSGAVANPLLCSAT